jgi:hypothetical protein
MWLDFAFDLFRSGSLDRQASGNNYTDRMFDIARVSAITQNRRV